MIETTTQTKQQVYSHSQQHIDSDKNKSNIEFINNIFPIIKKYIKANDYISIENQDNYILTLIDRESGIDGLIKLNDGGLVTVATRILSANRNGESYNTFCIRYKKNNNTTTEWDKLLIHKNNNTLRPQLTIQACKGSDNKVNIGIIETDVLINFIEEWGQYDIKEGDNASFIVVKWRDILYRCPDKIIILNQDGIRLTKAY